MTSLGLKGCTNFIHWSAGESGYLLKNLDFYQMLRLWLVSGQMTGNQSGPAHA